MMMQANWLEDDRLMARSEEDRPSPIRRRVALYVDRTTRQWVVRDPVGDWWSLPSTDDGWMHRAPFELSEDSELESVPRHYLSMLNLPF